MANVEKNAKKLPGKKYYVDAAEVLTSRKKLEKPTNYARSVIIDASKVVVSGKPVRLRHGTKDEPLPSKRSWHSFLGIQVLDLLRKRIKLAH